MRLIATADWHIHEFSDFSKVLSVTWDSTSQRFIELEAPEAKPMNSRLFNILNGLCDMRDYAIHNGITHVINAGDVFHKRGNISVTAFNAVHKVLESFHRAGISMYIIAGNHDQVDASISPETSIHTFKDIACIFEKPQILSIASGMDGVDLAFVPYSKDKSFVIEQIHELKLQLNSKQSILVAHVGITGGRVGSGMYIMSDEYSLDDLEYNKWKYVVLGHYHQPQRLADNVIYAGTPVQNSFGDELLDDHEGGGFNGFYVLDTNEENSMQFVPIKAPRFITVKSPGELDRSIKEYGENNFYRVKASTSDVEEIATMENVRVEVEKEYKEAARSDIGLNDTLQDAVIKYSRENYKGTNSDITKFGLVILNSVLSGGGADDV